MATAGNDYKGFKKGYKVIFRLPGYRILYLLLLLVAVPEAILLPATRIPLAYIIVATHVLLIIDRKLFIPRRLAALALYILFIIQPLLLAGTQAEVVCTASLAVFVVVATLASPLTASPYLVVALASTLYMKPVGIVTALISSLAVLALLYRIDHRIRKTVGVSGIGFLNAFFHYILAGRKEKLEDFLKKISRVRTLTIHLYRIKSGEQPVLDIVVSEIHPGPFREIGSSTLPQAFMGRHTPTMFLKAPATHSENLASSENIEEIVGRVIHSHCDVATATVETNDLEGDYLSALTLKPLQAPPLVILEPQTSIEDLPRQLIEDTCHVLVDAHSLIDKESYIFIVPRTQLYLEALTLIGKALESRGTIGRLRAAAKHIDYSDGAEIAPGGITVALLEVGGRRLLIVNIDGNNMNPEFNALLRKRLSQYADNVAITTTDTHLYSGSISRVEYKPVGTENTEILGIIEAVAKSLSGELEDAAISYHPEPVHSHYIDGEALARISEETEKNLKDGIKVFLIITLAPLAFALLDKFGYLLPVLINHTLDLFHILLG